MLYTYINQFEKLQASNYVTSQLGLMDSLNASNPFCKITLKDLYTERDKEVLIYPAQKAIYGYLSNTKEIVVFDPTGIQNVLVSRQLFVAKE